MKTTNILLHRFFSSSFSPSNLYFGFLLHSVRWDFLPFRSYESVFSLFSNMEEFWLFFWQRQNLFESLVKFRNNWWDQFLWIFSPLQGSVHAPAWKRPPRRYVRISVWSNCSILGNLPWPTLVLPPFPPSVLFVSIVHCPRGAIEYVEHSLDRLRRDMEPRPGFSFVIPLDFFLLNPFVLGSCCATVLLSNRTNGRFSNFDRTTCIANCVPILSRFKIWIYFSKYIPGAKYRTSPAGSKWTSTVGPHFPPSFLLMRQRSLGSIKESRSCVLNRWPPVPWFGARIPPARVISRRSRTPTRRWSTPSTGRWGSSGTWSPARPTRPDQGRPGRRFGGHTICLDSQPGHIVS